MFPDNSYMLQSKNDTAFLKGGQVNIPQVTGNVPVTEISDYGKDTRVSAQRTDESIAYNIRQLKTQATFLQDSEDLVVNYAKRASLVEQHAEELTEYAADFVQHEWASNTSAKMLRTGGDARVGTTGTGNRKAIRFEDLLEVRKAFRKDNVSMDNLCALISPEMEMDLLKMTEVTSTDYQGKGTGTGVLRMGDVDRILRIQFYVRSTINSFTNAATPVLKDQGTNAANADNAGALFWSSKYVSLARGAVKVLYEAGQPKIGGDEISSLMRLGALYRRKDGKGVVNLVESAA